MARDSAVRLTVFAVDGPYARGGYDVCLVGFEDSNENQYYWTVKDFRLLKGVEKDNVYDARFSIEKEAGCMFRISNVQLTPVKG